MDESRGTTNQFGIDGILELIDQDHPIGCWCEQEGDEGNPLQTLAVMNIVESRQYHLSDELEDFWR